MNNLALERAKRELLDGMQQHGIPEQSREGLLNYLCHGILPGTFLQHVIENNLQGAAFSADRENLSHLKGFAMLLHWHFPPQAYGNTQRRREWCKHGGLAGLLDSERNAAHA